MSNSTVSDPQGSRQRSSHSPSPGTDEKVSFVFLGRDRLRTESGDTPRPKPRLALTWLGLAWIYNPWTFDWLLGTGSLYTATGEFVVFALGLVCICMSFWSLRRNRSRGAQKLQIALLMTLAGVPVAGEVLIRIAIERENHKFRNASLYLDSLSDDDYWKLNAKWRTRPSPGNDPRLGWRTPRTPENPLGIFRRDGYLPQFENTVLCFGDSFTAGNVPLGEKIPDYIDKELDGLVAYNYGVAGYGVGQMYLSYLMHEPEFVDPIIVVGIFVRDLDRTILGVRDGPKPVFRIENGELALHGVPIPATRAEWDAANPLELRSFFLAWVTRGLWMLSLDGLPMNSAYRRDEKVALNRAILAAQVADARVKGLKLLYVTYPPSNFLEGGDWRTPFLGEVFTDLGVPWMNGEAVLRADMQATGRAASEYFQPDNHPNSAANKMYAQATLRKLNELWGVPNKLAK